MVRLMEVEVGSLSTLMISDLGTSVCLPRLPVASEIFCSEGVHRRFPALRPKTHHRCNEVGKGP